MTDEELAEEYASQSCYTEMPNPSLSESIDISDDIKEAVMFGYNKANEWHYVKDGDLPTEEKEYLVYTKEWGIEIRGYFADDKYFSCRRNMVIAWKEIVPPELPKENE